MDFRPLEIVREMMDYRDKLANELQRMEHSRHDSALNDMKYRVTRDVLMDIYRILDNNGAPEYGSETPLETFHKPLNVDVNLGLMERYNYDINQLRKEIFK